MMFSTAGGLAVSRFAACIVLSRWCGNAPVACEGEALAVTAW
jgi:hypothetical protein